MKFKLSDLKRELEGPAELQPVSLQAVNEQILITIKALKSNSIVERNTVIFDGMVKYMAETKLKCRRKGLFLFGNTGTGKTFAAKVISSYRDIHLYTCRDLEAKYKKSETHFWEIIKDRKDIIIDDLGTEKTRNEYGIKFELFEEALDERHKLFEQYGTKTIVTANMSGEAIKERYSERIYSRIRSMCECINATGKDLRLVVVGKTLNRECERKDLRL